MALSPWKSVCLSLWHILSIRQPYKQLALQLMARATLNDLSSTINKFTIWVVYKRQVLHHEISLTGNENRDILLHNINRTTVIRTSTKLLRDSGTLFRTCRFAEWTIFTSLSPKSLYDIPQCISSRAMSNNPEQKAEVVCKFETLHALARSRDSIPVDALTERRWRLGD